MYRARQELEADQRDDAGGTGLPRETTLVFSRNSAWSIDPTSELTTARPGGEFYEPSILSRAPDRGGCWCAVSPWTAGVVSRKRSSRRTSVVPSARWNHGSQSG